MADEDVTLAPETDNPVEVSQTEDKPGSAPEPPPGDKADAAPADVVPAKEVAPDWAADWREKMAGDDEKELKRLQRYKSPVDVYKSARELEKRMSAAKVELPENATEEQLAAYRKDRGIPDKPDGYLEKLPSGLVIGDDDKPMLESFLGRVHGKNATPEVVAETLDWYYAQQEEAIAAQAQSDKEYQQKSDDSLRAEWGAEYRGNLNSVMSFLDNAPEDDNGTPLKQMLLGARLSDGTPLGDNPTALKWLAQLAHDANPSGFVSPGVGGSQADSVAEEIAKIEGVMKTNRSAYDKDEKMQARLRQLYDAQEKLSK